MRVSSLRRRECLLRARRIEDDACYFSGWDSASRNILKTVRDFFSWWMQDVECGSVEYEMLE